MKAGRKKKCLFLLQPVRALWQAEARATAAEAAVVALQTKLVDHITANSLQCPPEGTPIVPCDVDALALELHMLRERLATPDAAAMVEASKTLRSAAAKLQLKGSASNSNLSVCIRGYDALIPAQSFLCG